MIAHRGASQYELENTKEAFIAAGNRSFFGVETDLNITQDKNIVTFHDADLIRLAFRPEKIQDLTLSELRKIPLFGGFDHIDTYRVSTLSEYLRICRHYQKKCWIELKGAFNDEMIDHAVFDIQKEGMEKSCCFISFKLEHLLYLRSRYPHFLLQLLVGDLVDDEVLASCCENRFDLSLHYELADAQIIEFIHKNNLKVNCWTVNDQALAKRLTGHGVDYITSNFEVC